MRLGKLSLVESASHTPPEDRQARLSGAGCWYLRRKAKEHSMMHAERLFFLTYTDFFLPGSLIIISRPPKIVKQKFLFFLY